MLQRCVRFDATLIPGKHSNSKEILLAYIQISKRDENQKMQDVWFI